MPLLINERKLKAAATSMHQFCQEVRSIFPGETSDRSVEAATVYLYVNIARDLFGPRFAAKLQKRMRAQLKYATGAEVEGHVARISKHAEALERAVRARTPTRCPEDVVHTHVACVLEAMLSDAGFPANDAEITRQAFSKFDEAVKAIRTHLAGIKEQNHFVMKSKAPV